VIQICVSQINFFSVNASFKNSRKWIICCSISETKFFEIGVLAKFKRDFHEECYTIGVLAKVDKKVTFSDTSFFNYFALEDCLNYLKENHQKEKTFEFCGKFLSDRENFSELCWLIEKFFAQKIQ
jgi:hypothetical protein